MTSVNGEGVASINGENAKAVRNEKRIKQ